MTLVLVAARLVHFGASMTLFGALLFPLYAGARTRLPLTTLAMIALCSAIVWALCVAFTISAGLEAPFSVQTFATISTSTSFGRAWLAHLALGALLPLIAQRHGCLAPAIATAHLASQAWLGHAAIGEGDIGALHLSVDALHLLAGGAWLGGVASLGILLTRDQSAAARVAVLGFSRMAYGAVALILMTGFANLAMTTGAWLPNLSTGYGRFLSLKIALVVALLAVAAFNRFYATRERRGLLLLRAILLEHILFAAILIDVAYFATQAPME